MGITGTKAIVNTRAAPMRHFPQIVDLIEKSSLSGRVKTQSVAMFEKLATAEAHIHGCAIENVHFHEVGAVDSIVDIVGGVCGLEALGIDHIVFSPLPLGTGFVNCQHGRLPVPAPATIDILKDIPVYGTQIPYELVTPTGALFAKCLAESYGPIPQMQIIKTGYGAGSRQLDDRPNLLRIILGKALPADGSNTVCESVGLIETQMDDITPECLSHAMSQLMSAGALDALIIPVHMKKNRSGHQLQVICRPSDIAPLTDMILQETSSIGVRYQIVQRKVLKRQIKTVQTKLGSVQAKEIIQPDGSIRLTPEFDSCQKLAKEKGISLQDIYKVVI
ncbi:MAG: hypothetical protein OMM_00059 [Candidatus Magnetoglobus multicellularis str. Araruama]|uniref:Nickel insertion protein n=1 Tax=Candidatus Magnetoglobus multicellularis str. Araruama TaxID=890399 RepID=A0A1V1PIN4_9BACT|nr:MAG: hypothetical protein OMM_00059 [Candidatus Magnetoglobus multicellularis str. Araruama]